MELFRLSLSCICLLPWLEVSEGQGFLIRNTRLEKCIHVSHHEADSIGLGECMPHSQQQRWSWDPTSGTITNLQTKQCLSARRTQEHGLAKMEPCRNKEHQVWACGKKGHLTLQSFGFHLSTKDGGHKVFVSREKDKFSRWKTLEDETICAAARRAALRPAEPMRGVVDTRVWIYESDKVPNLTQGKLFPSYEGLMASERFSALQKRLKKKYDEFCWSKTIDSSKTDAMERESSMGLTDPPLMNKLNSTVVPAKTKQAYLPEQEDVSYNHSKKHHGNRGKTTGARLAGTNWKTAMLVLSPLAFILGLIILTLNVHYNKKKKILSSLKNPPASSRADLRETSPLRRCPHPYLPPSRSPSLRHGEILIEWKDGTVTPLFDNANYQVD